MSGESKKEIVAKVKLILKSVDPALENIEIDTNEKFFETGKIDSILLISILNQIESEFAIKVTPQEFTPENFANLDAITEMILRIKSNGH